MKPDGSVAIVCGVRRRRRPPCACGAPSAYACDGPRRHHAGKSPTCDRPLCGRCRIHVPPNQDFCKDHRIQAQDAAAQLRLFDGRRVLRACEVNKEPLHLRGALARRQQQFNQAENARTQITYHGPGPTFGELAIGERFYWPPPIPRGPEPMVKSGDDRYEWSRGYGTAEGFYRVERWEQPT